MYKSSCISKRRKKFRIIIHEDYTFCIISKKSPLMKLRNLFQFCIVQRITILKKKKKKEIEWITRYIVQTPDKSVCLRRNIPQMYSLEPIATFHDRDSMALFAYEFPADLLFAMEIYLCRRPQLATIEDAFESLERTFLHPNSQVGRAGSAGERIVGSLLLRIGLRLSRPAMELPSLRISIHGLLTQ